MLLQPKNGVLQKFNFWRSPMNHKKLICLSLMSFLAFGVLGGCQSQEEAAEAPLPREVAQRAETEAVEQTPASPAKASVAEELFEKHCAACHPEGGNVMKAEKTLKTESLAEHGIKTPQDIVKVLRNPGAGMPTYDPETIPDEEALQLGKYILETY